MIITFGRFLIILISDGSAGKSRGTYGRKPLSSKVRVTQATRTFRRRPCEEFALAVLTAPSYHTRGLCRQSHYICSIQGPTRCVLTPVGFIKRTPRQHQTRSQTGLLGQRTTFARLPC